MEKSQTELKHYKKASFNNEEELNQKFKKYEKKYETLFNNSTSGIAYHKIIYDSNGKPINYIITDVNPHYEILLSIKKEDVINKTATESYKVNEAPYLDIYSMVAETQKSCSFETYFQPLDTYFKITVSSPEKGEFMTVFDDISKRKKLLESEEKYRLITENANDLIAVLNDKLEFEYINEIVHKIIVGYTEEDLIGFTNLELIHPEDRKNTTLAVSRILRKGKGTHQLRFKTKNGKYKWLEVTSKYFKDSNGNKKILNISRDITERKEIEEKLRESEENYRELVNDANSIILRWDSEGKIKFINEFGESFFGYSKSGLVGKHIIGTIVPKTETTGRDLKKLMENICKDPEIYKNNVNENITKYGRKVWISWTNKAIKDDQDNLIGILSVGNDITKQRLATIKISESEDKFRTITEQSFIGIAILKDFEFKYVNQQFSDTLGYTPKEILKWKPKEFFKLIHPEDRKRIIEIADKKYYGENEVLAELEFRVIKKTGELIWLEIISKTIPFKGNDADLIATLDITEKKEAERLVLEENRKLVELNKMRKDIITRVSHELKTPLTSIYGASQILLKHYDGKIDEEVLSFIEIFHRGALRLKKLVENLIDASRIESGKLELYLKMNDLVKITKECVEEMSYLLNSRKLNVKLNLPDELAFNVDKIRLQQVITNLLSNAIKNTPISGKIYVNLVDNNDYIDIQIRDKGVGITEKEKELLFEKFGKMERYGMDLGVDIEGSGLGLFISKEIVELHGGQILVESKGRNKGSTFTIRLF